MTAKRANRKPTGKCRKANSQRENKLSKSRKGNGKYQQNMQLINDDNKPRIKAQINKICNYLMQQHI